MYRNSRLAARYAAYATRRLQTNYTGGTAATASRALFSTTTATTNSKDTFPPSLDVAKETIIESALEQVHQHGWTEDAISNAVISSKLPLSMMGMVTPCDLIAHFMDNCQDRLQSELDSTLIPKWKQENEAMANLSRRLETALKLRLEYVVPFVKSNKWHEGMALGATSNTTITASQLDRMVQSIANAIIVGTNHAPLGLLERTAIGALYVSTELHLVTDESDNNEATWDFLRARIAEMQLLAQSADWNSVANGDAAIAATAVASSLGGAVVSLLQPAARGAVSAAASSVVPHLATFLQPPLQQQASGDGTRASDYNMQSPPTAGVNDTEDSKTPVTATN